jgi:ketosteroid isomerase-like protein
MFVTLFVLVALALSLYAQEKRSTAIAALAESERAFAKTGVEKGVRDSFIEYFAPDGINFTPHPTNTREALSKRPIGRPPVTLNWNPIYSDISQAGDLGFNTGPYTVIDDKTQKLIRTGFFFSLWKKQPDGTWKVVVDCGIQTPEAVPFNTPLQAAMPSAYKAKAGNLESERESLLKTDRDFLAQAENAGVKKAYENTLSNEARLYRDEHLPIIGKAAIEKFLGDKMMSMKGAPIKADIAASADFGYTYGSYELREAGTKGYYVRTWKRNAEGKWQIVLDVVTILPKEQ